MQIPPVECCDLQAWLGENAKNHCAFPHFFACCAVNLAVISYPAPCNARLEAAASCLFVDRHSITSYVFWLCPTVSGSTMTASRTLPCSCEEAEVFVIAHHMNGGVAVKLVHDDAHDVYMTLPCHTG